MFQNIVNPHNHTLVDVKSNEGRKILNNYIRKLKKFGGFEQLINGVEESKSEHQEESKSEHQEPEPTIEEKTDIENIQMSIKNFSRSDIEECCWFDTEKFNSMLIENNALLAGGFVLNAIDNTNKWTSNDMDIYVNKRNAENVVNFINDMCNGVYSDEDFLELYPNIQHYNKAQQAPPYDMSFFRKNGIIYRLHYNIIFEKDKLEYYIPLSFKRPIDVIIVDDSTLLTDVCSNFDLTICEVWWNGKTLSTWSPENMQNIKNKKGFLREEYQEALFKHFNKFIVNRLQKYISRGFSIEFSCQSGVLTKAKKELISQEEAYIIYLITNTIYDSINVNDFENLNLNQDEYNNLLQQNRELWIIKNLLPANPTIDMLKEMVDRSKFLDNNIFDNFLVGDDIPDEFSKLDKFKKFCLYNLLYNCVYLREYQQGNLYRDSINNFFGFDLWVTNLWNFDLIRYNENLYRLKPDYYPIMNYILNKHHVKKDIVLQYTPKIQFANTCHNISDFGSDVVIELHPKQIELANIESRIRTAMGTGKRSDIIDLSRIKTKFMSENRELLSKLRKDQDTSQYDNSELLSNNETFLLVFDSETVICYTLEFLINICSNYGIWFSECVGGVIDINNGDRYPDYAKTKQQSFYAGIPIDKNGLSGYVELSEILKIIELVRYKGIKIFYIRPKLVPDLEFIYEKFLIYLDLIEEAKKQKIDIDIDDIRDSSLLKKQRVELNNFFGPNLSEKIIDIINNIDISNPEDYIRTKIKQIDINLIKEKFDDIEYLQLQFTHTISYNNLFGRSPNYVSSNHCQKGSTILIYEICLPNE